MWLFPIGLLLGAVALSLLPGVGEGESTFGLYFVCAVPLLQLAWSFVALVRSPGRRGVVAVVLVAQIALTVLLFTPALGLATGFGRTWR